MAARSSGTVRIGLVGLLRRGRQLAPAIQACGATIRAVCDVREDRLEACARHLGAAEAYADYRQMLDRAELDAVVIATPMPLHAWQSVAALERGLHVLCEVPAAVSIDECRQLVRAAARSRAVYMMAEQRVFARPAVLVRELVRRGLFGEVYYAEGSYVLDLKRLAEATPWRRRWLLGVDGVTYGTHPLGPILQWLGDDRLARVCCAGSGHHHRDARGQPFEGQDTCVMLGQTARGALVQVRMDIQSDRPADYQHYHLQGTDGVYDSGHDLPGGGERVWLRSLDPVPRWHELAAQMDVGSLGRHLPAAYRDAPEEVFRTGHGGQEHFLVADFLSAVRGERPPTVGIHQAMDITLACLASQESIAGGGAWAPVGDSRTWR